MNDPYQRLAKQLDHLPNGFPASADGSELRLLALLFTPAEAALAAELSASLETPAEITQRLNQRGGDFSERELADLLRGMARKGLIKAGRCAGGLGFSLLPFVVGIYEAQIGRIDAQLAELFESYYQQAFGQVLAIQPAIHRVIPIGESVRQDQQIHPYESAAQIVNTAQAWGVLDCICRTQQALIGKACSHPVDVCMILAPLPGAFDHHPLIRPLTQEAALATLQRAAAAGLVHSVSNSQEGLAYICNCCTCACGILRGIAELGIGGAVARSAFVNQVDLELCLDCQTCLSYCQFGALALNNGHVGVIHSRCVGCGVCIPSCPEGALYLVRRPPQDAPPPPLNETEWGSQRLAARQNC
jgi:Pyruvate/2-oxoacid:ferredoxin oxidoreductase delta subunit